MKAELTPNTFGIGTNIFGVTPPPALPTPTQSKEDDHGNDDDLSDVESNSTSSEEELLTAMASVTVEKSLWKSAPSYPPLYLSTASEYLPPLTKPKLPPGAQDILADDDKGGKDISWASEAYEDSLEMDHVFERFTKRVAYEGEQCVRYASFI